MSKPTIWHGGNYKEYRDHLVAQRKDFVLRQTLRTAKIETNECNYLFSDSRMTQAEMALQRQMKKEIKVEHNALFPEIPEYTPQYYYFSESLREIEKFGGSYHEFKNVIELDITSAYYQAAFNLGYISKEFFDRCKSIPKPWRLRLIGSIATAKDVFTYEKGKMVNHIVKKNKKNRRMWGNIVAYVDSCMAGVKDIIGKDFLFYWVDGIFMTTEHSNKTNLINMANIVFSRHKFDFDITDIPKMEMVNIDGSSQIRIHKPGGGFKPYFISKHETKAYYLEEDLI